MEDVKFTRQELYDLVWSEPISSLLKKYKNVDGGVKQACRNLNIPLPNIGYWAMVQYGKRAVARRPLPDFAGEQTVILKLKEDKENDEAPDQISHAALKKEIEHDERLNLIVPERLSNPDQLIIRVKDDLNNKEVWNKNEGIARSSTGELDIRVNPKNIGRALRIMDTLIKAFKARGHEFKIKAGKTYLIINGEEIVICLREKLNRVIIKGPHYDSSKKIASGLLSIRIDESYNVKEWVDGKKPLEEQLPSVITSLELKAKKMLEERIIWEKHRKEQAEKDRIAKALQQKKDMELADFKELLRKAKRHDLAEMIRKYILELERNALLKNTLSVEVIKEIEWARKKADWYDPFVEAYDELLHGADRERLSF
jgi:hypothetical protein